MAVGSHANLQLTLGQNTPTKLHVRELPGRPDVVLPRYKAVILVHGRFWHRHQNCHWCTQPAANPEFGNSKFERNVERDAEIARRLHEAGWRIGRDMQPESEARPVKGSPQDDLGLGILAPNPGHHPRPGRSGSAKKLSCWEAFRDLWIEIPAGVRDEFVTRDGTRAAEGAHVFEEQVSAEESELVARVAAVASQTWFDIAAWAKDTQSLQPWQRSISFTLGKQAGIGKPPTRKRAVQGERILKEARSLGFRG